jgi:hypothetical protein
MALRKALKEFMEMPPCGDVAEWIRSGLQNRLPRFNSGRRLQPLDMSSYWLRRTGAAGKPVTPVRRARKCRRRG